LITPQLGYAYLIFSAFKGFLKNRVGENVGKKPCGIKCYLLGLAGIVGATIFLLIMFALDIIQSGPNPILKTISELAHGSYGWLQTLAFVMVAFLFFIFVSRLYSATKRKISSLVGVSFLGITSIGFFLIAFFPGQTTGLEQAFQQLMHNSAAGLISSSFIIGCCIFAFYFRKDQRWKRYSTYTIVTVIFSLAFALMWALIPFEMKLMWLGERLLLTTGFLWVIVISLRLVSLCRKPQEVIVSKYDRE
jgi:hypothetical protein